MRFLEIEPERYGIWRWGEKLWGMTPLNPSIIDWWKLLLQNMRCQMPTSSSLADDVQLPRIHHGYFRNFNSHGKILVYNKLEMKMLILLNFFFLFFEKRLLVLWR